MRRITSLLCFIFLFSMLVACGNGLSEGAVAPIDGGCPVDHSIKGNKDSMIFHLQGGQYYSRTNAEECFSSAEDAVKAGYRKSKR